MITIQQLCKQHGARVILRNIDAHVAAGESIAIVGPSGGGKSTLLRCINLLETFASGQIAVCGTTLTAQTRPTDPMLRALRGRVGMVFQQFHLFAHLTALQNVALAPTLVKGVATARLSKHASASRSQTLLEKVGLGAHCQAYPHQLSGGQQQRVAIARALAMQPEVLLFDEPTSALDPEMRNEVIAVMRSLAADGMTMLTVTHDMRLATRVASRIWVLDQGTLVEDGPTDNVISAPQSRVAADYFARHRDE